MLGVENLLSSIAIPEPFSLEIVGDSGGVSLLARCRDGSFVRQQVGGRYPQAQVNEVSPEDDPLRLDGGEQAYSMSLRLKGPEYLPLRTFRDDDLLDPGSDPLISVIGSLSDLEEGERLVARLRLLSLGPDWSSAHQEKAYGRPLPDPKASPYHTDERINRNSMTHLAILGVFAVPALQCYLWIQRGETWKAVLLGLGAVSLAALAGWAWWRIKKWRSGGKHQDPLLIKEKVSRIAYEAHLEVTAILSEHGAEGRARECCGTSPRPTATTTTQREPASGPPRSALRFPIRSRRLPAGTVRGPGRVGSAGAGGPVASPGGRRPVAHGGPHRGQGAVPLV